MKVSIIPVTDYAQNCSLICCEQTGKAAVIDPGGDIDRILAQARHLGVSIEKLLITHGHFDHCGAALDLAEQSGAHILGPHEDDAFLLETLPEWARRVGFPPARSFTPERWLKAGDSVRVGDIELNLLHCPGHTPGHVVFYQPEEQLAFVGDVLFKGSIGRTDFPRGDHQALLDSIQNTLFPLGDNVRFIPGHGPESTFGEERRKNPFLIR